MSELHTHYEVKNGRLVPRKGGRPAEGKEGKDEQGGPDAGSSSGSIGHGDEKK